MLFQELYQVPARCARARAKAALARPLLKEWALLAVLQSTAGRSKQPIRDLPRRTATQLAKEHPETP